MAVHFSKSLLFWVFILAVAWCYNYPEILKKGPASIHQWRQADCLSITQNFYIENRPFLQPAIHWVGEEDGMTVSECPVIYYSVAKLWQWFGKSYVLFRLINIGLVFLGLWSLFRVALRVTGSLFWALYVPLFLFSSPILVYYTNNFMADAPAFGLALTGGYLAYLGITENKKWAYYLAFPVFLLAGLIKISALILFCALLLFHLWYFIRGKLKSVPQGWFAFLPYLITISGLFFWYRYARHYNESHLSGIFLTDLYPIWDLNRAEIKEIWRSMTHELLPAYFTEQGLWLLGLIWVLVFCKWKHVNRFWFLLTLIVSGGVLAYILLFYKAFTVHDYYLTNLLILIPVLLLTVFQWAKDNHPDWTGKMWVKVLAGIVLFLFIYKTALTNRMKYDARDPWLAYNFVVSDSRVDFWDWFHTDYRDHKQAFEFITPYLRSLGITRNDRVLSWSDPSINISLYLMDQKGFSAFGYDALPLQDRIKLYARNDVKYIILDNLGDNNEPLEPYLGDKIGTFRNLSVYDFRFEGRPDQ